jgi:hypothetical protein
MATTNVTPLVRGTRESFPAAATAIQEPRRSLAGDRAGSYSAELPGAPPSSVASARIFLALTVAKRFLHRTPTLEELQAEFGMCRSTAYRWRGAILAAKGEC